MNRVVSHYKQYPSSYLLRGKGARPKSSHKNQLGIYPAQELLPPGIFGPPSILSLSSLIEKIQIRNLRKSLLGLSCSLEEFVTPKLSSHLVAELRIEDYSISTGTFPPNAPSE